MMSNTDMRVDVWIWQPFVTLPLLFKQYPNKDNNISYYFFKPPQQIIYILNQILIVVPCVDYIIKVNQISKIKLKFIVLYNDTIIVPKTKGMIFRIVL